MTSYRYYKLTQASTSQIDIGGFFTGDKLGARDFRCQPSAAAVVLRCRTYHEHHVVNLTNDFHYSYLRNYWSWADQERTTAGLQVLAEPWSRR